MALDEVQRLRNALNYAIAILEMYQSELDTPTISIMAAERVIEQQCSLATVGFCQGMVYQKAIADIRRMAEDNGSR